MKNNKRKEIKDKKIRMFKATGQAVSGFERVWKKYIHSKKSGGVWAYVRHLSEREQFAAKAVNREETILFKVAYHPKITNDLYVEFAGKTFNIVSIDPYEFNNTDLVIRASEAAPPPFDVVDWGKM